MAKTTTRVTDAESGWIDGRLESLTDLWSELPQVASEIDGWDHVEQIAYTEEWGAHNSNLHELERSVKRGQLSDEQMDRYQHLLTLVRQNSRFLEKIMTGP